MKWRVETTASVKAAVSQYEMFPPDLVLIDSANVEGELDTLLEHAKRHWPRTFFSLLSDLPETSFQSAIERYGSLPIIAPSDPQQVSKAIEKEMVGLVNGTLQGLMLSSFLQMMEWESKSVSIHVLGEGRWGRIHLHQGKFVSAYVHPMNLTDEQAAIEILMWDNISISVERSYHNQKHQKAVALSSLIMDAMVRKDELALNAPAQEMLPSQEDRPPELAAPLLTLSNDTIEKLFSDTTFDEPAVHSAAANQNIFEEDAFVYEDPSVRPPDQKLADQKLNEALSVSEELEDDEVELYIIQNSVSVPNREIEKKLISKPNSHDVLVQDILSIDGAVAAALVDVSNGMTLDMVGSGLDLELAGAGSTEVVKAQQRAMLLLGIGGQIEDMMVTLEQQYHLVCMVPNTSLFLYVVLRKEQANVAMARYKLKAAASELHL